MREGEIILANLLPSDGNIKLKLVTRILNHEPARRQAGCMNELSTFLLIPGNS